MSGGFAEAIFACCLVKTKAREKFPLTAAALSAVIGRPAAETSSLALRSSSEKRQRAET
jgi:hypothetical protein